MGGEREECRPGRHFFGYCEKGRIGFAPALVIEFIMSEKVVLIQTRVPPDVREKLEALASAEGMTVFRAIRIVLEKVTEGVKLPAAAPTFALGTTYSPLRAFACLWTEKLSLTGNVLRQFSRRQSANFHGEDKHERKRRRFWKYPTVSRL